MLATNFYRIFVCSLLIAVLLPGKLLFAQDVNLLFNEGLTAYKSRNYDKAVSVFSQCQALIENNPSQLSMIYYWLAKATFFNENGRVKTMEMLDKSISLKEDFVDAYHFRMLLNLNIFNSTEALGDIKKILQYSEINSYKHTYAMYLFGSKDQAWEIVNRQLNDQKVQSANFLFIKAIFLASEGSTIEALNYLDQAMKAGFMAIDIVYLEFKKLLDKHELMDFVNKYNIPTFGENIQEIIKEYVESKINAWQKKGKYEKTADYTSRVNLDSRKLKIDYYTQQAIDSIAIAKIDFNVLQNEYDADNETFKIIFTELDPIYIGVPIADAQSFDNNFNKLEFGNTKFALTNDDLIVLQHIEITNPINDKIYVYDSELSTPFSSTQIEFDFEDIELSLVDFVDGNLKPKSETTKVISIGQSDVDLNIPISDAKSVNTYALVIGNEDYTKYQTNLGSETNVDYAINDAQIFAKYLENTLGLPKENISLIKNGISSQISREIEKLSKIAQYSGGEANLIFYYAGHGFPDEKTMTAYLMPVDVNASNINFGIKLSDLYSKLTSFPANKVIVILDACFSGGGRNEGLLAARSVKVKPKDDMLSGNIIVMTSSSGDQSSLPFHSKQHGMFTFFLLKKLQQTNGDVTLVELFDFVKKEVQLNSIKINNKDQNPSLILSIEAQNIWEDWRLK